MPEPLRLPRVLPRGPHGLSRTVVMASQRHRMLEGVVEAVAEKGYQATAIVDIVRRAGVSRATFYEHFAGKAECFVDAYMAGATALFEATRLTGSDEPDPVRRLRMGTHAYLAGLRAEPAWTKVGLIDVVAAGEVAASAREQVRGWYVQLIRDWHAWALTSMTPVGMVPEGVYEAAVYAVHELVAACVRSGDLEQLADLERAILYVDLTLCGFPEEAQRLLTEIGEPARRPPVQASA